MLSQVLAHAVNNGYQGYHDLEVRSVNGHSVKNLRHMKELVEGNAAADTGGDEWIEILLEGSRVVRFHPQCLLSLCSCLTCLTLMFHVSLMAQGLFHVSL